MGLDRDYNEIVASKMESTIVYWGYIGIMEHQMETTIASGPKLHIWEPLEVPIISYMGFPLKLFGLSPINPKPQNPKSRNRTDSGEPGESANAASCAGVRNL